MPRPSKITEFPNRLRALRHEAGLTLQQVSDMTGIPFTNIGKMETGERDLKHWHMDAFCRIYDVPQADLLNADKGGLSREERLLIDTYRELPASLRRTFDALRDTQQEMRGASEVVPLLSPDEDDRKRA